VAEDAVVIGGGLAGCEAALQLARAGHRVVLYEMRPVVSSPAHHTDLLGELVCSNSLKSSDPVTAAGQLKRELRALGSQLLQIARETAVPAGGALAVDRNQFAEAVTRTVEKHSLVHVIRQEITTIPESRAVIVATGPLSSEGIQSAITELIGPHRLAFFDAAAPIIDADTIDQRRAFPASRYGKGGGSDYLNCPLSQPQYEAFVQELVRAERMRPHSFESADLFQACQPVEEIARRGLDALRYGSLKPVGLTDPSTGERPWAVVQLRPENAAKTAYNLVGFQTNLTFQEQRRVFRMVPGLENAEFLRHGVMHRNTFIDAPRLLDKTLALRADPRISFAGQITGTEGYTEAIATGLLAGANAAARLSGCPSVVLPETTALGALVSYATDPETEHYQPMHVNWGLVPPLDQRIRGRRERYAAYAARATDDLERYLRSRRPGTVSDAC